MLAVVLSKTVDGFYKFGTKTGILKQLYAKSEVSLCKERFLGRKCRRNAVEKSLLHTAIEQSLVRVSENVVANLIVPPIGVFVAKSIS